MKLRCWGVQGSLPNPLSSVQIREKIAEALRLAGGKTFTVAGELQAFLDSLPFHLTHTAGGNTTCFEIISARGTHVIVDLGSGSRKLGVELLQGEAGKGRATIHVLLTHLHWDHIQGFPFFLPAYTPGNQIIIHGVHPYLEEALTRQMHLQNFPVGLHEMEAQVRFDYLKEGEEFSLGDLTINTKRLHHPGGSYAYRFTEGGKTLVIATDAEYQQLDADYLQPFLDFYRNAEVLVFDAQYTLKEVFHKIDWGHSSPFIGVDICLMANVGKLVLTHHDPAYSDEKMAAILQKTQQFKNEALQQLPQQRTRDLEIVMAYEGLEVNL